MLRVSQSLVQLRLYHVMEPLLLRRAVSPSCQPPAGDPVPLQCNGQITVNEDNTADCQQTVMPSTCPPTTFDQGHGACVYPRVDGACRYGTDTPGNGNCHIKQPVSPMCWGLESNSAGNCIISSPPIPCDGTIVTPGGR